MGNALQCLRSGKKLQHSVPVLRTFTTQKFTVKVTVYKNKHTGYTVSTNKEVTLVERKMATVRKVKNVVDADNSDNLSVVTVDGWRVVAK